MDNWEMNVMLVDGTLYLEEHQTPERLKVKYVFTFFLFILLYCLPFQRELTNVPGTT